jgi:hypothetical protein
VKKQRKIGLDFEVDKLTNSIENVVSGDSFATEISIVTLFDLKSITKKNRWQFDWKFEYNSGTYSGTGNLYADQLLLPYVINKMVVI